MVSQEKPDWTGTAYEIAIGAGMPARSHGRPGRRGGRCGGAAAIKETCHQACSQGTGSLREGLASLQEDRLTEAIEEAARTVEYMQMLGHKARDDWFEEENGMVKAAVSGVELLEGTLIAAANEFERRKVKLVANLWSQLAFNPSVDFDTCVFLLKTANELSYQQLAILAALTELAGPPPTARDAELDLAVAEGPVVVPLQGEHSNHPFRGSSTLASQVFDLIRRDIIRQGADQVPFNAGQVRPWACSPGLTGQRLYVLTAMRTHVPINEKKALAEELKKHT